MNGFGEEVALRPSRSDEARRYTAIPSTEPLQQQGVPIDAAMCKIMSEKTAEHLKKSLSTEEFNLMLAGAKLIGGLHFVREGRVGIETGSVYGAAILVPQVARTLGWPRLLSATSTKVYGLLFLCILVHGGLLTLLSQEEEVFDTFAGQPYLCDFGANCRGVEGASCKGPGGSKITLDRLYQYGDWVTRNYIRDSLKILFPKRIDEIDRHIDPGEYGVETYHGRLLCCFIFITSLNPELDLAINLARLLWYAPTDQTPWIELKQDNQKEENTIQWWLNHVIVKVGGISLKWKIFNCVFILIPKLGLWLLTALSGINFLMETAGTDDVIVNACALGFLLSLDNLILEAFASAETKCLMDRCEDIPISTGVDDGDIEENDILHQYHFEERIGMYWTHFASSLLPWKLLRVSFLTFLFVARYYRTHCVWQDGGWVSKPMFKPTSETFSFLNTFSLVFPIEHESKPYWTMPP